MARALLFLIFLFSIGPSSAQSSGNAAKIIGDAFRSQRKQAEKVPERDQKILFAYASGILKNLVKFRDDGIATSVYRLSGTEQHIEWQNLRFSFIRAELVTDAEHANGITRKYAIGLACDAHRTWNKRTRTWSTWRTRSFSMFPSILRFQERDGRVSLTNTFHGTFGRGPGTATAVLPPPVKARPIEPQISESSTPSPPSRQAPAVQSLKALPIPAFNLSAAPEASPPDSSPQSPLLRAFCALVVLLALGAFLFCISQIKSLPGSKGQRGERRVATLLSRLDPAIYQVHHDIYIPRRDGTGLTQIDHLVISPFGIFVIETKNYTGWIFGSENQKKWTQQIYRKKFRFQNPLHQNHLHLSSLASHLVLPQDRFHSLVVFAGNATIKTPMPPNVISNHLIHWILAHRTQTLTPPELAAVRSQLADLDLRTDRPAAEQAHLASLRLRHG